MAKPHEKLAASLAELEKLHRRQRRVFRSNEFTRVHRERLVASGYLRQVIKGWLVLSSPGGGLCDTTPWFASFWEFCARYCAARFGDQWRVSPEQSLILHAENTVVPRQVIIYTPKGANNTIALPFGTSLYDLKHVRMPPEADLCEVEGLRLFTLEAALVKVPQAFFARSPVEAQVALSGIPDASGVIRRLLEGGHSVIAGRLAGGFRRIGRAELADEILRPMRAAGYATRASDPFVAQPKLGAASHGAATVVRRLQVMWDASRQRIAAAFPQTPGLPEDPKKYLRLVDEVYQSDAYHSLSIEGYRVTRDLIERVRTGNWDPNSVDSDRRRRDALAARGYWQTFQLVREAISKIIVGGDPANLVRAAHGDWYLELFRPFATAGLVEASTLAGYRSNAVFLRGSRHPPLRWETVRDAMPALFNLLEKETEPSVRAVLGHWLFGYIHPYPDGNGRLARFAMNCMLASGGYPWTVIRVEDHGRYLAALETASVDQDIEPFARFVAKQVESSLQQEDDTE